MASKEYDVLGIAAVKYKWRTFKRWLHLYRKYDLDGLIPSTRKNKGKSRKIGQKLERNILFQAKENDLKTVSNFY